MSFIRIIAWLTVCFAISIFCFPILASAQDVDVCPTFSAQCAEVYEASGGRTVYSRNAQTEVPMASTTKIMTALVALERLDPASTVRIPKEAVGIEGSSVYLAEGEPLTVEDLLYALLLESANDAAAALALTVSDSIPAFADLMNEKAGSLGLTHTHFMNPHGLDDENHYTSAHDLAVLAAAALENETFREIVSTKRRVIPQNGGEGARVLVNHNRLLHLYDDVIGVKTGFTKRSGRCLVSAAERDGVRLICVTLNDGDDWRDHRAMLDYGFTRFTRVRLCDAHEYTIALPCVNADGDVLCTNRDACFAVLANEDAARVRVETHAPHLAAAPVEEGDRVGELRFFLDDRLIASCDLVATARVDAYEGRENLIRKLFKKSS